MVSLTQTSGFDCYVCLHLHGTIVTQRDKVENWDVQILKCVKGLEPPRVHREPLSTACLSGLGEFSLARPLPSSPVQHIPVLLLDKGNLRWEMQGWMGGPGVFWPVTASVLHVPVSSAYLYIYTEAFPHLFCNSVYLDEWGGKAGRNEG